MLILVSGFLEAIDIPGLLVAIGLDVVEELVARFFNHCWSRLGHNSFFFAAAHQAEILGVASRTEMADIEQIKKVVPFIMREITLVKMSAIWCLVSK